MTESLPSLSNQLDSFKRTGPKGGEYWMGRVLQQVLGYETWENFERAIEKARMACETYGEDQNDHFRETTKMIVAGKGAKRAAKDFFLTRYACYLVAMNGDSSKPEIAIAQTYFAVQTRRQEIQSDANAFLAKRVELRERVTHANKALNAVAKTAGVQNYGLFHDAGYRGLYGMGLREIKQKKKIEGDLLDHAGRAELAANEFRITQAEQKIVREKVDGEKSAIETHREVGSRVRATIKSLNGTMPEDLKPEPSIKRLLSESKKEQRKLPKPD